MSPTETSPAATSATVPPRPVLGPSPWPWMALACLLLVASGAVRVYQERQFDTAARTVTVPPYPMRDLPQALGPWQMREEQTLEKETLDIAGCSDYMARIYADDRTGVILSALVAFGPAERVYSHAPTVCFPAFGYSIARSAKTHTIETSIGSIPFRSLVYSKPAGGSTELVEVFYSFRHADRWAPDATDTRKQFRHRPAMFKVQVQRPIAPDEQQAKASPIEEFLAALVPEIEHRLAVEAEAEASAGAEVAAAIEHRPQG